MNPNQAVGNNPGAHPADYDVDATLRLVAQLPAPQGLEERVHEALRTAPRAARVLEWPMRAGQENGWMRGAAAAAIAFAVVGGGWGVYSRVQPAKVIAMPPRVMSPGGFSNAAAPRAPQTLDGPVIAHPASTQPVRPAAQGTAAAPRVAAMPGEKTRKTEKTSSPPAQ
jgi:hypothetical protein